MHSMQASPSVMTHAAAHAATMAPHLIQSHAEQPEGVIPARAARFLSRFLKTVPACLGSLIPLSFLVLWSLERPLARVLTDEHELSRYERQVIQSGLIDGPLSHPADSYGNDVTYINCEPVHASCLAKSVNRVEERELYIPAIRLGSADRTLLDLYAVELQSSIDGGSIDVLELEGIRGSIIQRPLLRSDAKVADLVVNSLKEVLDSRNLLLKCCRLFLLRSGLAGQRCDQSTDRPTVHTTNLRDDYRHSNRAGERHLSPYVSRHRDPLSSLGQLRFEELPKHVIPGGGKCPRRLNGIYRGAVYVECPDDRGSVFRRLLQISQQRTGIVNVYAGVL